MSFVKKVFKELYARLVKRRVQEFNVENRAFRLLDKGDLPRAPGHLTEVEALKKFLDQNPHLAEEVKTKDGKLVDNMGQVKINVKYPPEPAKKKKDKLPKDRSIIPKDTNVKVDHIPAGCIDFEILLKIFDYKYNHKWSNEEIAEEFELDEKNVNDLIFYFKPFDNIVHDKQEIYPADRDSPFTYYSYLKLAHLLGRDPETYKVIPNYMKEIQLAKQEDEMVKLIEEAEEGDNDETEEQELERIENMKFKQEKFYIAAPDDESGQDSKDSKDEKKSEEQMKNDELKNEEKKKRKKLRGEKLKNIKKDKEDDVDKVKELKKS